MSNIFDLVNDGNIENITLFLNENKNNLNIDLLDEKNTSALMYAVNYGDYDISELLLKHNANPNLVVKDYDNVLYDAVSKEFEDIVELLIKYGANVFPLKSNSVQFDAVEQSIKKGNLNIFNILYNSNLINFDTKHELMNDYLEIAAYSGNLDIFNQLNKYIPINENHLLIALENNNKNICDEIINNHFDVVDDYSILEKALFFYVINNDPSPFKKMYDRGIEFNKVNENKLNLVEEAFENNAYDSLLALLDYKVKINTQDSTQTIIHRAIKQYDPESLEKLVSHPVLNKYINKQNSIGETPIVEAVDLIKMKEIEILIKHGANINILRPDGMTILQYLDDKIHGNSEVDYIDSNGETESISIDVVNHPMEELKQFIIKCSNDTIAFPYTYTNEIEKEFINIILTKNDIIAKLFFEENKKEINLDNIKDHNKRNILFYCIEENMLQTTNIIIDNSNLINELDNSQENIASFVLKNQNLSEEDKLIYLTSFIEAGINLNQQNNTLNTPISYAIKLNSTVLVKFLMDEGASLNIKDKFGYNSISHAILFNQNEALKALLEYPVPKSALKETTWFAVKNKNYDAISILIDKENKLLLDLNEENDNIGHYILKKLNQVPTSKLIKTLTYLYNNGLDFNLKNNDNLSIHDLLEQNSFIRDELFEAIPKIKY